MPQLYPQLRTTDATPTLMPAMITVPEDTTAALRAVVAASDHNGGDSVWRMDISVRRIGSAAPQSLGSPIKQGSASAAAWAVAVSFDADGTLRVQATGEAGKTIDWTFVMDDFYGGIGRQLNASFAG